MRNINIKRQGGWIQIAALALSAIGTVAGFMGSKNSEKAANKQARKEAEAEKKVTAEKLRQLEIEERALMGETIAAYAGSGVISNAGGSKGTPAVLLAEQAKEFAAQKKITKEVGASKVQQSLMAGKATADAYRYSGYANVASGISNMLTTYQLTKGP